MSTLQQNELQEKLVAGLWVMTRGTVAAARAATIATIIPVQRVRATHWIDVARQRGTFDLPNSSEWVRPLLFIRGVEEASCATVV